MGLTTIAAIIVAVIIAVVLSWASSTAQRLHRLHIRTDAARQSLQAALDRRAAVFSALYPQLADVAAAAEAIFLEYDRFAARAEAERSLSQEINNLPQLPPAIIDAEARLQLAHRFYNEAVSDTRALRVRPMVRLFHLGGTARLPEYFELVL